MSFSYRLSPTVRCHTTMISKTLEVTQKSQLKKSQACKLQRKNRELKKMVSHQPSKVAHQDHSTLKVSQSPSIREKASIPRADQETSITHQVRSWSTWLNSHIMITSMETKDNSILLSKSSRLKCANISSTMENAHFNSIASLLTDHLS